MGYMTDGLTFNTLREGNTLRLPEFKNAQGGAAHSEPDGSDWCLAQWCNALAGEVGEAAEQLALFQIVVARVGSAANTIKKVERGDIALEDARKLLEKEFADVATYLDLLAFRCGINLGNAIMDKFNDVSKRVGSRVWIDADGAHLHHRGLR